MVVISYVAGRCVVEGAWSGTSSIRLDRIGKCRPGPRYGTRADYRETTNDWLVTPLSIAILQTYAPLVSESGAHHRTDRLLGFALTFVLMQDLHAVVAET